jgi:hypothetical protein
VDSRCCGRILQNTATVATLLRVVWRHGMRLQRLNNEGIGRMAQWLDELRAGQIQPIPRDLVQPSAYTEPIIWQREVGERHFGTRFQFASYLDEVLRGDAEQSVSRDKGFWAWLSMFYFEEVCPKDSKGLRKPGHEARYIPDSADFRTYYRHLLAGPWRVYRAHRDNPSATLAVLSGPLDKPGEVAEQFASRQELVSNPTVMEAVSQLYFDRRAGQLRRGSGGRGRGSARRLAEVLMQFDLTFDLQRIGTSGLLRLLPEEFDRFRASSA